MVAIVTGIKVVQTVTVLMLVAVVKEGTVVEVVKIV